MGSIPTSLTIELEPKPTASMILEADLQQLLSTCHVLKPFSSSCDALKAPSPDTACAALRGSRSCPWREADVGVGEARYWAYDIRAALITTLVQCTVLTAPLPPHHRHPPHLFPRVLKKGVPQCLLLPSPLTRPLRTSEQFDPHVSLKSKAGQRASF